MGKSGSGFGLKLIGESGRRLEIQASNDLKAWESIAEKTMGEQPIEVEDPTAASQEQRFYRVLENE